MPKFRKKPVVIEAEEFQSDRSPLPFQNEGVCCYAAGEWWPSFSCLTSGSDS